MVLSHIQVLKMTTETPPVQALSDCELCVGAGEFAHPKAFRT